MRPLTITHVDCERTWRGGQQSLLTLARGLRDRGHHQLVVCPSDSALARRARAETFDIADDVPRTGDIVHAHSGRAHNTVLRATLGAKLRRIVTRHVAFPPRHPMIHRLKYTKTCDGIIAVSEAVSRTLLRAGIPAARIEVIHTGVEIPAHVTHTPHTGFVAGHLGAFTHEKGQDLLIEAARALPRVRFLLAGEGPLAAHLKRVAPPNVTFLGFVENAAAFFGRLDLFVMPSRSEAWGLAALEAMAHGVPVIAADVEGLSEIVEPPHRFRPNDAAALVAAIETAMDSDLTDWRETAQRRASEFSVARMAEQTEAFYLR